MKILREIGEWFESLFIRNMPGKIGIRIRRLYWSGRLSRGFPFFLSPGCAITAPANIAMGKEVKIMRNCCLYAHNRGLIKLGDRVGMNNNVILGASDDGKIEIGNDVLIGFNTVIRASNHKYARKKIPIIEQDHTGGRIIIEDDVWIGANVAVLPNVIIGKGAVIGAGAVVNRSVPPYALAAGVPAKVVKENYRGED